MKRGQNLGSPFTLYFMQAVQCTKLIVRGNIARTHTEMIARIPFSTVEPKFTFRRKSKSNFQKAMEKKNSDPKNKSQ